MKIYDTFNVIKIHLKYIVFVHLIKIFLPEKGSVTSIMTPTPVSMNPDDRVRLCKPTKSLKAVICTLTQIPGIHTF